jgi:hypothetical protein
MGDIDLNKYQLAWKKGNTFQAEGLSESEILKFIKSASKIEGQYKRALVFDIVLKSILIIAIFILSYKFKQQTEPLVTVLVLLPVAVFGILWQLHAYKQIEKISANDFNLKQLLESYISFFNSKYVTSLFVNALSSTLFFLIGSMFYMHIKYGEIPPLDLDDIIVIIIGIIASYGFSAAVHIMQNNYQIKQLETCLEQIEEDNINALNLDTYKKNRIVNIVVNGIALITGIVAFWYLVIEFFK